MKILFFKLFYFVICKIYSEITSLLETILYRKSKANTNFSKLRFFKYKNNKLNIENLVKLKSLHVNKYLSVKIISRQNSINLIKEIFDYEFRKYISSITGFEYSIDFLIAYDRRNIDFQDRNVDTLSQWYSYIWHFDKPNSTHMLKIIVPINISTSHGPLTILDFQKSKNIMFNQNQINDNEKLFKLTGLSNKLYGFNPTVCFHRDGIPNPNLVATQIMFQLNPWHSWAINECLFSQKSQLNTKLKIWTQEPKFPWIAYRNDKRVPIDKL